MATQHIFEFLDSKESPVPGVIAFFGDEPFLTRLGAKHLQSLLLESEDIPVASFDGGDCEWRDVNDVLHTVSLFGQDQQIAFVHDADTFVSNHRDKLEKLAAKEKSSAYLILQVGNWAANTRLYKVINKTSLQVDCRAPLKPKGKPNVDRNAVSRWLISRSKSFHQATLDKTASQVLLELIGVEFGALDQELAKLALFAGVNGKVTPEMVREVVGGWTHKTAWDMVDAAAGGNTAEALRLLDRLLQTGENPLGMFGQISWSLRRFAAATAMYEYRRARGENPSLPDVVEQAGFRKWPPEVLEKATSQLKRLKRSRARELHRWLLQADLELKGTHSTPARARSVLERLIFKISL